MGGWVGGVCVGGCACRLFFPSFFKCFASVHPRETCRHGCLCCRQASGRSWAGVGRSRLPRCCRPTPGSHPRIPDPAPTPLHPLLLLHGLAVLPLHSPGCTLLQAPAWCCLWLICTTLTQPARGPPPFLCPCCCRHRHGAAHEAALQQDGVPGGGRQQVLRTGSFSSASAHGDGRTPRSAVPCSTGRTCLQRCLSCGLSNECSVPRADPPPPALQPAVPPKLQDPRLRRRARHRGGCCRRRRRCRCRSCTVVEVGGQPGPPMAHSMP